jgi:uncharacterized protein (TIGR00269 family)
MATTTTQCSRCTKNHAVMTRYSGEHVCKSCFLKEVEDKIRKTMAHYKMLDANDKLVLAVSGGKDSTVLARTISKIHGNLLRQQAMNGHRPVAITIDEGITKYRAESIAIAKSTCNDIGIDHLVFSFKDEFGMDLDAMVAAMGRDEFLETIVQKQPEGQLKNAFKIIAKPCSICGVLRRRVLNDLAAGLHATKLATGHNLNDEAETFFINLFKGDINRMGRAGAVLSDDESSPFVKKIKPLQNVPQQDIVLYLYYTGGDFQDSPCPYARDNVFRGEARGMLTRLEGNHAGTLFNIKKFMDVVYPILARSTDQKQFSACSKCGAPKSKELDICMACYYVDTICGKDYATVMRSFVERNVNG